MQDVQEYAVTVIGSDRPGMVARTTRILAELGLNLTDSTMTRLRGQFAITLVCAGTASLEQIQEALGGLTEDGSLVAMAQTVPAVDAAVDPGDHYLLTVHGADRLGIVAALTEVVSKAGGNVTDLTTRLVGDLYVVVAEVDLPPTVDHDELDSQLRNVAQELGVEATLRAGEADLL
jgi:glycine cleavage system transcriptional repressor